MTKRILTQQYIKECLSYDPETGVFIWLSRPRDHFATEGAMNQINARCAGKVAGSVNDQGYLLIRIADRQRRAHRLAFLYMTGREPDKTDHINHDRLDNRWGNLRSVTFAENSKNVSVRKTNKARCPGVAWHKGTCKWRARIKREHLGLFASMDEAIAARKMAERQLGFHENHGAA